MRLVVQRASAAAVRVASEVVGEIDRRPGDVVGVTHDDTPATAARLAGRSDAADLRRRAVSRAARAPMLVVSQFTLYADTRKGRRPSGTARPRAVSEPLVESFVEALRALGAEVASVFGADMEVSLVNDGPVTLIPTPFDCPRLPARRSGQRGDTMISEISTASRVVAAEPGGVEALMVVSWLAVFTGIGWSVQPRCCHWRLLEAGAVREAQVTAAIRRYSRSGARRSSGRSGVAVDQPTSAIVPHQINSDRRPTPSSLQRQAVLGLSSKGCRQIGPRGCLHRRSRAALAVRNRADRRDGQHVALVRRRGRRRCVRVGVESGGVEPPVGSVAVC